MKHFAQEHDEICSAYDSLEKYVKEEEISEFHKVGALLIISEFKAEDSPNASELLPDYIEGIAERACDEYGESAEGWPQSTPEQDNELFEQLKEVVDKWADKHNLHPSFYRCHIIAKHLIKVTDSTPYFELIDTIQGDGVVLGLMESALKVIVNQVGDISYELREDEAWRNFVAEYSLRGVEADDINELGQSLIGNADWEHWFMEKQKPKKNTPEPTSFFDEPVEPDE
jgi:hypothetical protein